MREPLPAFLRGAASRYGIVALVAAAFLAAWLLYPAAESRDGGEHEIVLWMKLDPMLFDPVKPALEEFERRHPGTHVHLGTSTTRDEDGDPTRFLLGVAGGVPPDLIFFDRFAIVEWASRGAFHDLNPLIARDAALPGAVHPGDYFDSAWQETQWQGGTFAIPTEINTRAFYYLEAPLERAGLVFRNDDPAVLQGKARAGAARPPRSWEEVCDKRAHLTGEVSAAGRVGGLSFLKRAGLNEGRKEGEPVDLAGLGVRSGDVVALIRGKKVFRGRIASVGAGEFAVDLRRDQAPGLAEIGAPFRGACEIKIYNQDDYVARLTRIDPETGRLEQAAFLPMYGNSWLYLFGWQNGAEFMNAAGDRVRLDSPEVVGALQWLQDVYDEMGGYEAANVFQKGATMGGIDPFLSGKIVMLVHLSNYLNTGILAFDPRLDFHVAPVPLPAARVRAGMKPISWSGGFAYAIPETARNKEGAWELLKWLSGPEANRILVEAQTSAMRAKGQSFVPSIDANRKNLERIDAEFLLGNPSLPVQVREAARQFRDLVPESRHRPVTPVGQRLWGEQVRATEAALNHLQTPYDALAYGTRQTQGALDEILHPPGGPRMNWHLFIAAYVALLAGSIAAMVIRQARRARRGVAGAGRWYEGYLAVSPWLVGFAVFGAGPILFSVVISFCSYDVLHPAVFTGLHNYAGLIGSHRDAVLGTRVWNDPLFWRSLGNTLFMVTSVPLSIVLGLAIAMLLNVEVRGAPFYRTLFYLPAIVPAVAGFLLWMWILDPGNGILNVVLRNLGVSRPPNWLQDSAWAKPSLILMSLWGVGGSMVIWIAGLKDIPPALYEAAKIDGASPWQRFVHVTLPLLSPYILFNTIMGLIGTFQIFDAAYVMTDGGPADSTLFYVYKLFNEAFRYLRMGTASAMAWLLFLLVLAITLFQLWLSRKWVHYRH